MPAIELQSPFSIAECEARLLDATDREGLKSWSGTRPGIGRIADKAIRLRKRIGYRNSFQTYLIGTLSSCDGGTRFVGKIGMHPFVRVGVLVWCLMVGLLSVPLWMDSLCGQAAGSLSPNHLASTPFLMMVFPFLMWGFVFCLAWFGRWLARDEEKFLIAFLTQVLAVQRPPDHL